MAVALESRQVQTLEPLPDIAGPIPAAFAISLFAAPATISTTPSLRTVTLDELVTLLGRHERRPNKDGRGWSGATYERGTTRANANVVEWSVAVGDLDHLSVDEYGKLRERLDSLGLGFIVYSTYSSTEMDLCLRVVIPLTKPIPAGLYARVWRQIDKVVFAGTNDPQTKDASRMSYLPAAPKGVATVAEYVPGLALDWEKLAAVGVASANEARTNGTPSAGRNLGIAPATAYFLAIGAPVGQQRSAALRATRALLASGWSVEETADKVWLGLRSSPVGDPMTPWTHDDALRLVRDLAAREPTPLEDRLGADALGRVSGVGGSPLAAAEPTARPERRPLTETGNAERLVDRHGGDLRYCHPGRTWFHWDGRRWKPDTTGEVRRLAKDVVRQSYAEAATVEDKSEREATAAWARKSESANARAAMVKLAESEPGIPIMPEDMDANPYLLNVLNGTIDLRTGQLRPHARGDNLTKVAPVYFDSNATAPTFVRFLERVLPDSDVRAFMQRASGYGATGDITAQALFFLYGGGANGKSTLLGVLQSMLGDYAKQAAPELLVSGGGNRHPTELADLVGARFVASVEVDEGKRLAETLVKQMTGGDRMKARVMRGDFFEWSPTHKLFLAANHRPEIRGTDYAIWRRIHLVPFTVTIPDAERDPSLATKLRAELSGILNWVIEGCLAWQRDGLGAPKSVKDATAEYRAEQDILADFIAERCVTDPRAWATAADLYRAYVSWCAAQGVAHPSSQAFGRRLGERGFVPDRRAVGGASTRVWDGLGLLAPASSSGPDACGDPGRIRTGISA